MLKKQSFLRYVNFSLIQLITFFWTKSAEGGRLILPAVKESKLYNIVNNPEIKGNGERTWIMRKKDKIKIPVTPIKYRTGYEEDSIQANAILPAYPFFQK